MTKDKQVITNVIKLNRKTFFFNKPILLPTERERDHFYYIKDSHNSFGTLFSIFFTLQY